ncbi:MAG: hypothetical protein KGJ06_02745 [Pseudomonadota bacterium]|nr:hypothetical protein [Pseudomonadota bacterium]
MTNDTQDWQPPEKRRNFLRSTLFIILVIVILFTVGCLFLYWMMDDYLGSHFDTNRYMMSKIESGGNDTYMMWKFDKRTGATELCTRTTDPAAPLVCVKSLSLDAKDLHNKPLAIEQPEQVSNKQCTAVVDTVLEEMQRWQASNGANAPQPRKDKTP